ncbi:C4-dicarboxylate transporter large subunit [Hyphomonas johnsonii MHS-2]|uniref:TRAP transporter large permease protein n=1 Tax=Hyphomonas johnsonii MHS-2 TaxID=1280950 RepID=A0A059FRT1_9PROT|nr:C4-dicarboxylate transporter large subunit [Hyphomonas johnsonii MHS-2]
MELIILLLLILAALLYFGVPVAIALAMSASAILVVLDIPMIVAVQRMASGLDVFVLLAIPLFIFAGDLMNQSGIARRLLRLADAIVGKAPGGLGQVTILASMLFGAVSGSAVASASALGSTLGPEMKEKGYDADFAVNVTTTASITGLLIPPSHNMIIYAAAAGAGVSVGDLFLGGILPGVVTGVILMGVAAVVATRRGYPPGSFPGWRALLVSALVAVPGILTAVIVVGGILAGIFTPTESAAIATVYTFIIAIIVYRSLSWTAFVTAVTNAVKTTSMVMFVIAAAGLFGWVLAVLRAPERLALLMDPVLGNFIATMLIINLILLVLGTFMDMAPLILISTPIFLPIAMAAGMDPVQFGVMLMLNLGIGLVTPPVGAVLFVGCAIQNIPVGRVLRTIWPFYLALVAALMVITFLPGVTLYLPSLFK